MGGYWSNAWNLARQLNIFVHTRSCLRQVEKYEQEHSFKYAGVVVARPDLLYKSCQFDFQRIADGVVFKNRGYHMDWVFAAPRKLFNNFSTPIFQCKASDSCCGQITDAQSY